MSYRNRSTIQHNKLFIQVYVNIKTNGKCEKEVSNSELTNEKSISGCIATLNLFEDADNDDGEVTGQPDDSGNHTNHNDNDLGEFKFLRKCRTNLCIGRIIGLVAMGDIEMSVYKQRC